MKVNVKKKTPSNEIPVVISTEFIKLQDAMKFANIVYSGGEAKQLILEEQVRSTAKCAPCGARSCAPATSLNSWARFT